MLTGYHLVASSEDQIPVPQIQGEETATERRSTDELNTGFAVVVPWERLIEIIESEPVEKEMNAVVNRRIQQSGYRPAVLGG